MFVSVILTTYETPDWLAKVLWGYAAQTHRHFEVVIADDGSGPSTANCIAYMRDATGLRLRHVWQPKQGFGKCRILNRAIVAAASDYLVFSDGDCIPRRDFLAQHVRLAQRGRFLSGGVVRLPRPLSEQISQDDITNGRTTNAAWLVRHGLRPSRKLLMLVARHFSPAVLDTLTTTRATFNGHNASAWKRDVLHVNGFDRADGLWRPGSRAGRAAVQRGHSAATDPASGRVRAPRTSARLRRSRGGDAESPDAQGHRASWLSLDGLWHLPAGRRVAIPHLGRSNRGSSTASRHADSASGLGIQPKRAGRDRRTPGKRVPHYDGRLNFEAGEVGVRQSSPPPGSAQSGRAPLCPARAHWR